MTVQIRQTSPTDVETLIALSRRTIRASYTPFLGQEAVNVFIGSGAADQYVADHVEHSTVIVADDAIVGYAVCKGHVIELMMIDQRHHRCGFGTRLLQHCEEALFAYYDALTLGELRGQPHSQHLLSQARLGTGGPVLRQGVGGQ
jgi:hypothetical protein